MKVLYPLFGIVTVLNTPFTRENKIDLPALKRNVEDAIRAGVAGFLAPAMASEVYKLSRDERQRMVAAVLEQANNRVPVIGGAGETDPKQRRRVVKDLLAIGCKKVLLQIPFENAAQFEKDVHQIAETDIEMIMLQDWDASGYGLPIDLICELFDSVEAFRCLKIEVVLDGVKYSQVL